MRDNVARQYNQHEFCEKLTNFLKKCEETNGKMLMLDENVRWIQQHALI
jgi:hypothetical protein